eukprot:c15227_g1_i1 orf=123-620(+)
MHTLHLTLPHQIETPAHAVLRSHMYIHMCEFAHACPHTHTTCHCAKESRLRLRHPNSPIAHVRICKNTRTHMHNIHTMCIPEHAHTHTQFLLPIAHKNISRQTCTHTHTSMHQQTYTAGHITHIQVDIQELPKCIKKRKSAPNTSVRTHTRLTWDIIGHLQQTHQ